MPDLYRESTVEQELWFRVEGKAKSTAEKEHVVPGCGVCFVQFCCVLKWFDIPKTHR